MPAITKADTSHSYDIKHNKFFGNCRVWTQVDMLTDKESNHLKCEEETLTDRTEVGISQWGSGAGNLELRLGKGLMLHLDDHILVAVRIDKGQVIRGIWEWFSDNMVAISRDHKLIVSFMAELAKGKRVVIQVGKERGNVALDGSAAAVKDFRSRMFPVVPVPAEGRHENQTHSMNLPQAEAHAQRAIANLRTIVNLRRVQPRPPGGVVGGMQKLLQRTYGQQVRARIINAWHLPIPEKIAQGLLAVALLTIDREGQVIRYELTRSSGNPSFDASLQRAVQASSPLPPLPETFPGDIMKVELLFTPSH